MADPESQEPKKEELSTDELNAVTGGNAIVEAIKFAQEVGRTVASRGVILGDGSGPEDLRVDGPIR
jgi:bacteriocin-like protein